MNVTLRSILQNRHCLGKTINITHSGCISGALGIQDVKLTPRNILSSIANLAPPYFYTLSHERYNFRKKKGYWTYT